MLVLRDPWHHQPIWCWGDKRVVTKKIMLLDQPPMGSTLVITSVDTMYQLTYDVYYRKIRANLAETH